MYPRFSFFNFPFYVFLLLTALLNPVFAQFSVVSITPTHGSTNVDTSANFTMAFSAPLDTIARYPNPEGFFINLYLYPDSLVGEHDSLVVSPDLTTVNVYGVSLVENTTYLFMIVNARSQGGDSLASPARVLFTTGSGLPVNTVSGVITYPSGDPTGTAVLLFDGNPFVDSGSLVNASVVPSSSGNYTVDFVAPGIYWPVALKNFIVTDEGFVDVMPGSVLGFYDSNGDHSPDSIDVSGNVTGIDISITELTPQTARDPYPSVQTAAQMWAADARLIELGGEALDENGNSVFWRYAFYSPSLMSYRLLMAFGNAVANVPPDGVMTDTSAIPGNWLDSDAILAITEANGGSEFRQNHPDANVTAFLGYPSFGNNAESVEIIPVPFGKTTRTDIGKFPFPSDFELNLLKNAQLLPAVWGVQYYVDTLMVNLAFLIDAVTGEILNAPSTAQMAEQYARDNALQWSADSRLWTMSSLDSLDASGKSGFWNCLYYSATLDSLHSVFIWGQIPVSEGNPGFTPSDTSTVETGWMDSDITIAEAEANGGAAYRNNNQNVFVQGILSRWFSGPNPELTIWEFNYTSSSAPPLQIYIDAITGNVITGIDESGLLSLPDRFILYQNYPNPFNPVTTISFNLPVADHVSIDVFNIAGQKILTLLDGRKNAGFHEVQLDASEFASGVYLYRVTTSEQSVIKKMILLK
jgi:hypothetical protein